MWVRLRCVWVGLRCVCVHGCVCGGGLRCVCVHGCVWGGVEVCVCAYVHVCMCESARVIANLRKLKMELTTTSIQTST